MLEGIGSSVQWKINIPIFQHRERKLLRAELRIEQLEASVYSRWYTRSLSVYTLATDDSMFFEYYVISKHLSEY